MRAIRAGAALLVVLGLSVPAAAGAGEPVCADHDRLREQLGAQYQERRFATGVTEAGGLLEIYVGPKETWTAVIVLPHGPACLIAAGEGWRSDPENAERIKGHHVGFPAAMAAGPRGR